MVNKTLNLDMSGLQYIFIRSYILLCHSLLKDSVFILTLMLSIPTIVSGCQKILVDYFCNSYNRVQNVPGHMSEHFSKY